jgi:glycine oxidase
MEGLGVRVTQASNYWIYPDDAIVDPRDVTRALIQVCRKLGAELHENEPVLNIAADGLSIQSAAGCYESTGVIIAAAARSSELFKDLPRTMPVRGHLISWRLEPGALPVILRSGHTYLFQRTSGLVIAGSTTEHVGWDDRFDSAAVADIHGRAAALFPRLKNLEPDEKWIGFRPGIEAAGPAIGKVPGTSVWTAFGHYRNGILMAPETARIIAEQIHT